MTAGSLQIKNGKYYAVLSYKNKEGKRVQKWIGLGIELVDGKKKECDFRAKEALHALQRSFVPPEEEGNMAPSVMYSDMPFCDFLILWLRFKKRKIEITTYSGYEMSLTKNIIPYFEKLNLKLSEFNAFHLESYCEYRLDSVSAKTVIAEFNIIHGALKYAFTHDLIPGNPADKVEKPKYVMHEADCYDEEELQEFLEKTKDCKYSLVYQITASYGLRRGEVLGLRWKSIDFKNNRFVIDNTLIETRIGGKKQIIGRDHAKTEKSIRAFALTPDVREALLELKAQQERDREMCGNSYNTDFLGYVFVDSMGNIFHPDTVSRSFGEILEKYGLRKITFHGLRHSNASILNAAGVPLLELSKWLGHSNTAITEKYYIHLYNFEEKKRLTDRVANLLTLPKKEKKDNWEE